MTAPVWMAVPPEVHSALLSTGPGPGSLLAAAGTWNLLSAEYAWAAEELSAVLAAVQAGVWEGSSAESYVAANQPFLVWLVQASANSAAEAARHEDVAAAYTGALAAMPTLAELAANHAIHAGLVATNFFGINTIPIALNEADYARMWVQAATTMATYQAVSGTAVASSPQIALAPQILKSRGSTAMRAATQAQAAQSGSLPGLGDLLLDITNRLGLNLLQIHGFGIKEVIADLDNPGLFLERAITRIVANPFAVLQNPLFLVFDGDELFFPLGQLLQLTYPVVAAAAVAPLGAASGLAGLAGLSAAGSAAPAQAPIAAAPDTWPAAGMAPTLPVPATAPIAPASTTAPASPATASAAPPAPPPATGGAAFAPPYAVGPPGIGSDSGMSAGASAGAKRAAPEPDIAAAAAAVGRGQTRAWRRRAKMRGYGDEFMGMDVEVDPDWGAPVDVGVPPAGEGDSAASTTASDRGGGPLAFAGTARKDTVGEAAGMTALAGDAFGNGPTVPMVRGTWDSEDGCPS